MMPSFGSGSQRIPTSRHDQASSSPISVSVCVCVRVQRRKSARSTTPIYHLCETVFFECVCWCCAAKIFFPWLSFFPWAGHHFYCFGFSSYQEQPQKKKEREIEQMFARRAKNLIAAICFHISAVLAFNAVAINASNGILFVKTTLTSFFPFSRFLMFRERSFCCKK